MQIVPHHGNPANIRLPGPISDLGDHFMALKTLVAATVAALPIFAIEAAARAPEPILPTALVEDVKSNGAGVEFMDYVGRGQVIKLAPGDTLVLSYLRSCEHE